MNLAHFGVVKQNFISRRNTYDSTGRSCSVLHALLFFELSFFTGLLSAKGKNQRPMASHGLIEVKPPQYRPPGAMWAPHGGGPGAARSGKIRDLQLYLN